MKDCANLDAVNSEELHNTDVWAGYISGAATQIWSVEDWKRVTHFPKLPIVVARNNKPGHYCGLEAIMAIEKLRIPGESAIALDIEPYNQEPFTLDHMIAFVDEFVPVLHHFHYEVWLYGSTSYLFDLPNADGYWVATDSQVVEQYPHPGVHATQYLFGNPYDSSLIHRYATHHWLKVNWGIYAV